MPDPADPLYQLEMQIYRGEMRRGEYGMLAEAFAVAEIVMDCIAETGSKGR